MMVREEIRKHARPLLEIVITFILIEVVLWTPRPMQAWLSLVTLLWIVGSTVLVRENRNAVELGMVGFKRSLWVMATALAFATLEILIARHEQTLHAPFGFSVVRYRIWGYVAWSFLQQFILQDYFLLRFLRILRKPSWAIVTSACLFAFAHFPNPVLTLATLIWGLIACSLFLRYRDLYSLGFAHAVLGLTIAISIPATMHHNMRVGLGYFRYHPHPRTVQRSQMDQMVSTDAWVIADAATRRSARQARP